MNAQHVFDFDTTPEQRCVCGAIAVYLFEGHEPMCATCPEPRQRTEIPSPPTLERINTQRDKAMHRVAQHAEDVRPSFGAQAADFVLTYLAMHGPTSSEILTTQCKADGIRAHDDRAFGPVYMLLAKRHLIEKVGSVRRSKGHGTSGGNVWGLRA